MGKNMPQVFINFRGKDERKKLLPHLKHHLKDSNVNVFTDDDAVGEPLENLFKHIRRSRIVIVIFSINYLESEWCLDELVWIMKCLKTEKIDFTIPIFYKVKTYHVKNQTGKFGKKFAGLQEKHCNPRVRKWKKALTYVANSIGLTYKKSSISELDFIKKIVERVNLTVTKVALKDNNNSNDTLETAKGEASNQIDIHPLNKIPHSSTTLEDLNLERCYLQGFIAGSTWKNVNISLMPSSSNSFGSSHPANPHQSRGYNWGVQPRQVLSTNFASFVEVPRSYKVLEPKVPQDFRRSISYHNNIIQYHPEPYEMVFDQYPTIHHQPFMGYGIAPISSPVKPGDQYPIHCQPIKSHDVAPVSSLLEWNECSKRWHPVPAHPMSEDALPCSPSEDRTSCISLLDYCFKRCFSLK